MIVLKTQREIEAMRKAGAICAQALRMAGEAVRPGVTTGELDRLIHKYIRSQGAVPSFLGYNGFPNSACISVNEEVIHGIPGERRIAEGDLVSIDVGAYIDGVHGDTAATFGAGEITEEAKKLLEVTRQALELGLAQVRAGGRIGDISAAVQQCVESNGFAVVRKFVGHGVGQDLHEAPEIPNFGKAGRGPRLAPGMTLAIEPMVNVRGTDVRILANDWTVVTVSGSLSAHFEHTVAVTEGGAPEILTLPR